MDLGLSGSGLLWRLGDSRGRVVLYCSTDLPRGETRSRLRVCLARSEPVSLCGGGNAFCGLPKATDDEWPIRFNKVNGYGSCH